jgi:hypothetical protein
VCALGRVGVRAQLLANFEDLLEAAPTSAAEPTAAASGAVGAVGGGVGSVPPQPAASPMATAASASADVVGWAEVEAAAQEETARSGRRVVCVRGSTIDCRGLAAVHAFIQLPYYDLVRAALARAHADADAGLEIAEAHVRAVAAGEPFDDTTLSGTAAAYRAAADSAHGAAAAAPVAPPPPPAPLPPPFTPPKAAPTPKLAPPPASAAPPRPPAAASHEPPASSPAGLGSALAIDAIDDSFFDGLDGPSATPAPSLPAPAPTQRAPHAPHAPVPALAPASPSAYAPPAADDDEHERETEDLLPLLEDPDGND